MNSDMTACYRHTHLPPALCQPEPECTCICLRLTHLSTVPVLHVCVHPTLWALLCSLICACCVCCYALLC